MIPNSVSNDQPVLDLLQSKDESVRLYSSKHNYFSNMTVSYDIRITISDISQGGNCSNFSVKSFPDWNVNTKNSQTFSLKDFPSVLENKKTMFMHRHNFFELMFVISGMVEQYIEDGCYLYKEGTACLMNCNTEHAELQSNFVAVYLCLSRDYLQNQVLINRELKPDSPLGTFFRNNIQEFSDFKKDYVRFTPHSSQSKETLATLINLISKEYVQAKPGSQQMIHGLIIRLFSLLQDPDSFLLEYNKLDVSAESYIFAKVTRLMEAQCSNISRTVISDALNYSSDYINRIVKKYSGMSIIQYNHFIRIKKAEYYLRETNISISEIIAKLGYENRTHFYHLFYGKNHMTPTEYRNYCMLRSANISSAEN